MRKRPERSKRAACLTGLTGVRAAGLPDGTGRAVGFPGSLVLKFRDASGPPTLSNGRELHAVLTLAELAEVLGVLPMLSVTDDEDAAALHRAARMLRGHSGVPT